MLNNDSHDQEPQVVVRVIDDDAAIREALSYLLSKSGIVCKTFDNAMSFLIQDTPSTPGCVILDVQMPDMDGIALQNEMLRRGICLPIIFYSGHGDMDMAVEAVRKGATTFLQKTVTSEHLLASVAEAIEVSLSYNSRRLNDVEISLRWDTLAQREKSIALMMGEGKVTADIARSLSVSPKTIYNYRVEIYRKLKTKTQADIARFVYRVKKILEAQ